MSPARIDPRAWLVWAAAMSFTPMLGRNPFPLLIALVVAITVRTSVTNPADAGWSRLIRLTIVFGTISVLFNVITYHGGDRVLGTIPEWVPIFGGPITLNAFVFGILSALALITLVVIWSTVATQLEWSELIRLTPPGLSGIAVSSSIAVTLVPKTIEAFGEIREVQQIRGFPMRGPRDLVPLVAPLLTLGLERSVTLSEALESRGFGGPEPDRPSADRGPLFVVTALTACALAAFLIVTGRELFGLTSLVVGALTGWLAVRESGRARAWRPTRYRPVAMDRYDRLIIAISLVSVGALLVINRIDRSALFYEPYPAIDWPAVNVPAMLVIALLLVPLAAPPENSGEKAP